MPTGGGKSLCYQLPSLLRLGVMVVVSPLIALMQDQVDALRNNGIAATFLNSSLHLTEVRERERQLLNGETKLLYVAPERLLSEGFWPFLSRLHQQVGISGFAIDEAHCVSEWGHDFRPEYRQLHRLRTSFPAVSMMALTATATARVREDIRAQLALQDPAVFVASFNRHNLYYEVLPKDRHAYAHLLRQIKGATGACIVYCLSRKRVEELATRLQQDGVAALPYHAGLADGTRSEHQNRFIRDDVQVMVATIAFGMGINKPDVRLVAHYDLPRTLESYYQESGRAGRDGEPAHCTVYFSYGDVSLINYIIEQKSDEQEQNIARQQLRQVLDYAESTVCRRQIQLSYFGEAFPGQCDRCDNCRHPKPTEDWTIEAQKFLSCVARCRERFGMTHVIDVLRGSQKKAHFRATARPTLDLRHRQRPQPRRMEAAGAIAPASGVSGGNHRWLSSAQAKCRQLAGAAPAAYRADCRAGNPERQPDRQRRNRRRGRWPVDPTAIAPQTPRRPAGHSSLHRVYGKHPARNGPTDAAIADPIWAHFRRR